MPARHLPIRPDLDQLKHQAKDLLRGVRLGDPDSLAELCEFHPHPPTAETARLADAQLALARSYQAPRWPRLVQACHLIDAIWRNDVEAVRALVTKRPALLHEPALVRDSNWGPPLSYAANLGRDAIIQALHDLGATDHLHAIERAALQGKVGTAHLLHELAGKPAVPAGALSGSAYTLNVAGTEFALGLGGQVADADGRRLAPVDVVLETDSRKPSAKHRILELYAEHGLTLPDTPVMALHRGRIDLLEQHLHHDPGLLRRTFAHSEIYPPEMGCRDPLDATVGTPLGGTSLLHLCVDYDEMDILQWLLDRGMDPNLRARVGPSGFGGYTALFCTVVSQPNFWMNFNGSRPMAAPMTALLLERGADPNVRASLWKRLHPGHGDSARHEYRDVTALLWGRRFHAPIFVSQPAMQLITEAGGEE
ncbi:MAG: ankyrin repeat domain-containing protein [Gemmatimonadota bacterium]|nr:ankyrin repeat domain-containing protein [Gemmatimonadota bacterium]